MDQIFRALPKLLDDFADNKEFREAVVLSAWKKIAGDALSEHTVPFRLFGKHLIVAVADKMWKRHLELLSGQMVYKLNSAVGLEVVTFIEFRIDEKMVADARTERPSRSQTADEMEEEALQRVTPELRRSADSIKDDDLRYQFLLAAGSCLERTERMRVKKQ